MKRTEQMQALHDLSSDELRGRREELQRALMAVRVRRAVLGNLEQPHQLREYRRELARINTLLSESSKLQREDTDA